MFSNLYLKVLSWSKKKNSSIWLFIVSFTESSFFPVPPDIMLIPMTIERRDHSLFFIILTTISSVLGGVFGYYIGMMFVDIVYPLIISFGYENLFISSKQLILDHGIWVIILAGFTPIPYKIFTIAAGFIGMDIIVFITGSIIGRGMRYGLVVGLVYKYGIKLNGMILKYIDKIGWYIIFLLCLIYFI